MPTPARRPALGAAGPGCGRPGLGTAGLGAGPGLGMARAWGWPGLGDGPARPPGDGGNVPDYPIVVDRPPLRRVIVPRRGRIPRCRERRRRICVPPSAPHTPAPAVTGNRESIVDRGQDMDGDRDTGITVTAS